ncbi:MAG: hypothetical protein AVO33_09955 [delta proteobacterium ML8_F1]|nr:MAG: hypothetical protein AVO33_09955 [delta proteobacterium ML8_F1]
MGQRYKCHKISEGRVRGQALVSKDAIMFYLMDPETGVVIEPQHDLEGKSVSNRILIFPSGKGSSVVQADGLYQLNMRGNLPAAMVVQYPETVLVSSAIIMEVPMIDKVDTEFYNRVRDGDWIELDADQGFIEILE